MRYNLPGSYLPQGPPSFMPSPYRVPLLQQPPPQPLPPSPVSRTLWFVQFYWLFWLAVSFLVSFAVSYPFLGGL